MTRAFDEVCFCFVEKKLNNRRAIVVVGLTDLDTLIHLIFYDWRVSRCALESHFVVPQSSDDLESIKTDMCLLRLSKALLKNVPGFSAFSTDNDSLSSTTQWWRYQEYQEKNLKGVRLFLCIRYMGISIE